MNESTSQDLMNSRRWLAIGLHGVFLVLVVIGVVRAGTTAALAAGSAIGALYLAGVLFRPRVGSQEEKAWLLALTALWAGASFFISPDFVWLAFPLFFLCLFMLSPRPALASVTGVLVISVGALAMDDGFEVAELVGPVVGAVVAVISAMSYIALSEEHRRTRQLLAELRATRDLLADAERERGALDERRRLAREVHDTIAQGLSSILLLARGSELSPGDESEQIREIGAIAQSNLEDARRIVAALDPAELDEDPLPQAIERIARRVADASGVDVGFGVEGDRRRISLDSEIALLRIAQGALANVNAHANARNVKVTLSYTTDETTLAIADDGVGFDSKEIRPTPESGYGLQIMEDRVGEVGGVLRVVSEAGSGTVVTASIARHNP